MEHFDQQGDIISTTLSKLFEMYISVEPETPSGCYIFHGFICGGYSDSALRLTSRGAYRLIHLCCTLVWPTHRNKFHPPTFLSRIAAWPSVADWKVGVLLNVRLGIWAKSQRYKDTQAHSLFCQIQRALVNTIDDVFGAMEFRLIKLIYAKRLFYLFFKWFPNEIV